MVNVYKSSMDSNVVGEITLIDFLGHTVCSHPKLIDLITTLRSINKTENRATYDYIKRQIPCATISATFEGKRQKQFVLHRNNLIVVDIDDGDNVYLRDADKREAVKQALFRLPYVYAIGTSSSGKGLYIIIPIASNKDDRDFRGYHNALLNEFAEAGIAIDPACKDITRTRIASSDPVLIKTDEYIDVYDKQVFTIETMATSYKPQFVQDEEFNVKLVGALIDELLSKGWEAVEHTDRVAVGFKLANVPNGEELFQRVIAASPSYDGYDATHNKFVRIQRVSSDSIEDAVRYFCSQAKRYIGGDYYKRVLTRINK